MRRLGVLALVVVLGVCGGCGGRTIGSQGDDGGDPAPDAGLQDGHVPGPDSTAPPDAGAETCGRDSLDMAFVVGTTVQPVETEPGVYDTIFSGSLIYQGDVTVPLASNPAFDREIQLQEVSGETHFLQYYLPLRLDVHLTLGHPYTVTFRNRQGFEGSAFGVVITRVASGITPHMLIADTSSYGRAFDEEDPIMTPLKVYAVTQNDCLVGPDPECAGNVYHDALRFDSSTGGAMTIAQIQQGRGDVLPLFGDEFLVLNLKSTRIQPDCPDRMGTRYAYLARRPPDTGFDCYPDRVRMMEPNVGTFDVGVLCDDISFCTSDPDLIVAAEETAPALRCRTSEWECAPGETYCGWGVPSNLVGEETYHEACLVTQLLTGDEQLTCAVYFD